MLVRDTIPAAAAYAATHWADEPAIHQGCRRLTFAEYVDRAGGVANGLVARGVTRGDRIAVWAPNGVDHAVVLLGLQLAGGVLVPVNTRFRDREVSQLLADARVSVLVTVEEFLGRRYADEARSLDLPDLREVLTVDTVPDWSLAGPPPADLTRGEDISAILFTSGTTGRPKGAMLRHDALVRGYREWSALTGMRHGDRVMVTNPFFHAFGLNVGLLAPLIHGATAYPVAVFDPGSVLALLRSERITYYPAPPTVFVALSDLVRAEGGGPLPSLRSAVIGATVIPRPTVDAMYDVLGVDDVHVPYGFTEASALATVTRRGDSRDVVCGTAGRPLPDITVRILDPNGVPVAPGETGEIEVSGYAVMPGYLDPETGQEQRPGTGGVVRSGDLGHVDAAGNLVIDGRIKDVVIVGGFNVYPAEVEACLVEHPAVAEVAVVGRPDDRLGEVAVAFVVRRAPVDEHELVAWCRDRIANFKVPRAVVVVDGLPMNASGKVLKRELRAQLPGGR
ncbi:fatty acid--CoA ligase [Nocardioides mangrovicus]|uniref:Fatty acid--CoA ligase n=1 Tax=Nocardioides mangrovicus TaxID=2478913 RepID=A0A3L8NVV4_9ACTN|nr:AMP-binding protein [Nocardioides mangrovicus]RLV47466.1 fatty acid--CoA ligase [Nocardioides mangrovicus]